MHYAQCSYALDSGAELLNMGFRRKREEYSMTKRVMFIDSATVEAQWPGYVTSVQRGDIGTVVRTEMNMATVAFASCLVTAHMSAFASVGRGRRIIKAARKHMRVYGQRAYVPADEDRRRYVDMVEMCRAKLELLLQYRDCWQYGRLIHGAVEGTKTQAKLTLLGELQYLKRVRA